MDISEKEEQGAVMPSAMSENEEVLSAGEKSQENISKKRKRHRRNKESYILTVRSRGEKILFAIVFVIFVVYAASLIYPFNCKIKAPVCGAFVPPKHLGCALASQLRRTFPQTKSKT